MKCPSCADSTAYRLKFENMDLCLFPPIEFYRDRGIGGDARYTLYCRVMLKPWSSATGWGSCRD